MTSCLKATYRYIKIYIIDKHMLDLLQETCTNVLTEPNVWCQTIIKPTMNMAIAAANCVPMP